MKDVVIVGALRTPIGCFRGALAGHSAVELGSLVVKALIERTGVPAYAVDEVILGQVLTAGAGQNPARQSAIKGGLPNSVSAITINDVCGSGLKALHLATQAIQCGEADIVIAGGQENMSRAPHVLTDSRTGAQLGNSQLVDSLVHDGLWDAFNDYHIGVTAEKPRTDTSAEGLARLNPSFDSLGSVTAGNASSINDGAAAVMMMSEAKARALNLPVLACIRAFASVGVDPALMGIAPVYATRRCLERVGWQLADVDLIEANEAFAAQALSVGKMLEWDERRVNVNGGAIALGHPIGASGCRILVSLVHEMVKRNARKGLATLCIGGGQGVALTIERDE
ncbi:TPA: acetyl-CoA C-acetyltransferase [Escherichia coli]|nr:acetyl-CoA C-acetyltransferase [Escherichia coli]